MRSARRSGRSTIICCGRARIANSTSGSARRSATHEGEGGVSFAVWAPNASRVSVVGDFNDWDGRRCQMRKRYDSGIWEIFIPHLGAGTVYKYEVVSAGGELQPLKADPFGFEAELRPSTATLVAYTTDFPWTDDSLDEGARRRGMAAQADVDLRMSARLVAARRGRTLAHLRRTGRPVDPLRARTWLHAYRADADHRISVRSVLGLSGAFGLFAPTKRFGTPEANSHASSTRRTRRGWASSSIGFRRIFPPTRMG